MTREEALAKANLAKALIDEIRTGYTDTFGSLDGKDLPDDYEPPIDCDLNHIAETLELRVIPLLEASSLQEYGQVVKRILIKAALSDFIKLALEGEKR